LAEPVVASGSSTVQVAPVDQEKLKEVEAGNENEEVKEPAPEDADEKTVT
jgi:hypothetical protein